MEETIAETAQKLAGDPSIPVQVSDAAALIRNLCRQISIKNEGGSSTASISRRFNENEELRKNIIIIAKEVEKHVVEAPPKLLNDFTNLLNVYRNNDIDVSSSLRMAISKRTKQVF